MERVLTAETLAFVLAKSRTDANQTQKYMAMSLGKSVSTIQNWEAGIGAPNMLDLTEWFHVLGLNPMYYILNILHPDTYRELSVNCSTDQLRQMLIDYFATSASDSEIRKLCYNIFGNTGSSWSAQLDMLTAHNHTTLKSRVMNSWSIYNTYLLEKARGELLCTDRILPDEESLKRAILSGQDSANNKKNGYTA